MAAAQDLGGSPMLVADDRDRPIDARRAKDLMAEAHEAGAARLVVAVEDLAPAFFELRSGLAGDILQAGVTYRMPLAIVGALPEPAASSGAFAALVREANRGPDCWFTADLRDLETRLNRRGDRATPTATSSGAHGSEAPRAGRCRCPGGGPGQP